MQQPTNAESSPASPSTSRRRLRRIPESASTAGAPSESPSATTTEQPVALNQISVPKPSPPSQPGDAPKSLVHVPNFVSADNILERAAATRTLKVSAEDIGAFTELLNQFREQDYLYARRQMHIDPSFNHYAANHFAGVPSFAASEEPRS